MGDFDATRVTRERRHVVEESVGHIQPARDLAHHRLHQCHERSARAVRARSELDVLALRETLDFPRFHRHRAGRVGAVILLPIPRRDAAVAPCRVAHLHEPRMADLPLRRQLLKVIHLIQIPRGSDHGRERRDASVLIHPHRVEDVNKLVGRNLPLKGIQRRAPLALEDAIGDRATHLVHDDAADIVVVPWTHRIIRIPDAVGLDGLDAELPLAAARIDLYQVPAVIAIHQQAPHRHGNQSAQPVTTSNIRLLAPRMEVILIHGVDLLIPRLRDILNRIGGVLHDARNDAAQDRKIPHHIPRIPQKHQTIPLHAPCLGGGVLLPAPAAATIRARLRGIIPKCLQPLPRLRPIHPRLGVKKRNCSIKKVHTLIAGRSTGYRFPQFSSCFNTETQLPLPYGLGLIVGFNLRLCRSCLASSIASALPRAGVFTLYPASSARCFGAKVIKNFRALSVK